MDRSIRFILAVAALLVAGYLAQPLIERVFFSASTPRAVTPRGSLSELERSTIELFERAAPSVVQVLSLTGDSAEASPAGSGTGFVWDDAGHVVTNNHVIERAQRIVVRFDLGEVVPAELVGRAPNHDLAVVRPSRGSAVRPPLAIGTSKDLKVGQSVFAIGNPFGLDQSLTTGVVSALKRRLPTSGGREVADVIQTDAAINPGNSGGPLLDSAGRLIGVNTAIFSPSGAYAGIGFAIPVDVVNRVVPELIRAGRVPVPGIGILAADETQAARLSVSGLIVAQVIPGMPAAQAGISGIDPSRRMIGDIIVAANGEPVRKLADLTDVLERVGVGGNVRLTLRREGREVPVNVPVVDVGQQR
jgi:2-alkenal reductase